MSLLRVFLLLISIILFRVLIINTKVKKVLLAVHVPPPIHGASKVGALVNSILKSEDGCDVRLVNIGLSNSIESIGRFSMKKVFNLIVTVCLAWFHRLFFRPDVICLTPAPSIFPLLRDILCVVFCARKKTRLILHLHAFGFNALWASRLGKVLIRKLFHGSEVILLSDWHRSDMPKDLIGELKTIWCLPNSIEGRVSPARSAPKAEGGSIRLLFISNMILSKGTVRTLYFLRNLLQSGLNVRCHFAGVFPSAEESAVFQEVVSSLGIEECVFLEGIVSGDVKERLFAETDFLVFPTNYPKEVFPLVVLESMQHGIPMILTRHASIPYMVDSEFCYFIDFHDDSEDCNVVDWILDDYPTKSRLAVGYFRENFSVSVFSENLKNIIFNYY